MSATSGARRPRSDRSKAGSPTDDRAALRPEVVVDKSVNRSQLQMIIAGLTDGVIIVEPDQTIAWANDAALAMHGVDSIEALGANVDEYRRNFQLQYRNNHRIDDGKYPIERVVGGERFDDVVVEVSRAGRSKPEWVHKIRSLVINDAHGTPDCLVLILKDATDRFQAEERFQKTFAANPAPAIICRLSDLRFVKLNQGFIEMTGYRKEQLLGRSTYEIDLMKDSERRAIGIERLSRGETIPQMEACIDLPGGGTKWVIVAGQPLEIGDEPCMLFTFADLERQKKAETSLRHSEERFEKAFRSSPVATVLLSATDFAFVAVNESFVRLLGLAETDVVGRRMDEIDLWVKEDALLRFRSQAVQTGTVPASEECLRHKAGDMLDCLISGVSIVVADQACLLCTILDITERKRGARSRRGHRQGDGRHVLVQQQPDREARRVAQRDTRRAARDGTRQPDPPREGDAALHLPRARRRPHRRGVAPVAEHRAQPHRLTVPQAPGPQSHRSRAVGARSRLLAGARTRQARDENQPEDGTLGTSSRHVKTVRSHHCTRSCRHPHRCRADGRRKPPSPLSQQDIRWTWIGSRARPRKSAASCSRDMGV